MKEKALEIMKILLDRNYSCVGVGGWPRDEMMGKTPKDYDLATNATPDNLQAIFGSAKSAGNIYGVSIIAGIDVATFRKDMSYTDGRHPDGVIFTESLQEDLSRRDFTVNAMAVTLGGTIIDPYGGQKDIENKIIRTVGDPFERFREDRLRIMRAIRFAQRLDFGIQRSTFDAMKEISIAGLKIERVRDELLESLSVRGLELMRASRVLQQVLPELELTIGCNQNPEYHPEGDVWIHTLKVLHALRNHDPIQKFAGILHDIGKPPTFDDSTGKITFRKHAEVGAGIADNICRRLKMSNDDREAIVWLVANHMRAHCGKEMRKHKLLELMRHPHFLALANLQSADSMGNPEKDLWSFYMDFGDMYEQEIKAEPLLKGDDLISLGFKPGPIFREILQGVRQTQDEGEISSGVEALIWVLGRYTP